MTVAPLVLGSYAPFELHTLTNMQFFRTVLIHALTYLAEILHNTFVLLYYRSSLSVINLRQFLWELRPFWNLEYSKYTVFRTFLLHALID